LCKSLPNMKNEIRAKKFVAIFQFFKNGQIWKEKKRKFHHIWTLMGIW
jgi:hypothetical protein